MPHPIPTSSRSQDGVDLLRAALAKLARPQIEAAAMTDTAERPDIHGIAGTLIEALPYMRRYQGAVMVIKYGGHAMGDENVAARLRPRRRPAQAGRHQPGRGPWRRAADQGHARPAEDPVGLRRRAARDRRRHRRGGRDGPRRQDQQGDRHRDPGRGRQGGRHQRQGRPADRGHQADPHQARPRQQHRAGGRSGLRRRARRGSTPSCSTCS